VNQPLTPTTGVVKSMLIEPLSSKTTVVPECGGNSCSERDRPATMAVALVRFTPG